MGEAQATCDVAVIGGGIAGASVAAQLAASSLVVLLEREDQPGYHTTGRSAATFSQTYGPPVIRALTRASAPLYEAPPHGFTTVPLLGPRGVLLVAREDQRHRIGETMRTLEGHRGVERLDGPEAEAMMPLLRPGYTCGAVFEADARDIDVHALHQGFLRQFRARGGAIRTGAEVTAMDRRDGRWRLRTPDATVSAQVVVNAAGAWAEAIGALAGAAPIGLVPKRRTIVTVPAPLGLDAALWPMVVDIDETFYLKPETGRFLISPADETPAPPCDAQAEDVDVAIAIDRIGRAFDLPIARVEGKWAGLRSFVADGAPVAGFDPMVPGFFWLAGQGGYGIQTAPALARLAAALVRGEGVPTDIAGEGVSETDLAPARLERAV